MAKAVAVDHWSADSVRLSEIVSALTVLRDQSDKHSSARTAVMTLIAVAPGDEEAYGATNALRSLSGAHPARLVIFRPDPDQVATLDARATLYAINTAYQRINFEEVTLSIGGQAALHLDSLAEAFTLSDLPVTVWYVNSIPSPADPLLSVATAVLIDSRDAPDAGDLRSLLELARRRVVADLSWYRLKPWRQLMAALFEPADMRDWLAGVDRVEVRGKVGPRRLLGGWLVAQLGLAPRQVTLGDARHASVVMTSVRDGATATFSVERAEGQRLVVAEAARPDGTFYRASASLPEDPLLSSLGAALTHLDPDPVWERALSAASAIAV